MNSQVLSIAQIQELIELGIDISKASMYRTVIKMDSIPSEVIVSKDYATYWMENSNIELTPTFTLQDILEMLPIIIRINSDLYHIRLTYEINKDLIIFYKCSNTEKTLKRVIGSSIEAAFNMLK